MNVVTHFDVVGRSRRLAPVVENNILRIGQEAISNAANIPGQNELTLRSNTRKTNSACGSGTTADGLEPNQTSVQQRRLWFDRNARARDGTPCAVTNPQRPNQGAEIVLSTPLSKE